MVAPEVDIVKFFQISVYLSVSIFNVGALIERPLRQDIANSPKSNANTQHFTARAIDDRPYSIHAALCVKLKFEAFCKK